MIKALNLGCGNRYCHGWINIDFSYTDVDVITHDLSTGIPACDREFDLVYHSHVLEHFPKEAAFGFVGECFRVLRPGGLLRVVVPDLETIVKAYLIALEEAIADAPGSTDNYNWMLLELLDQTARNQSGGAMGAYLQSSSLPNRGFVIQRLGTTAQEIISAGEQKRKAIDIESIDTESPLKKVARSLYHTFRYPGYRREKLLAVLLGQEYATLQLGRFRQSGEVHQWMYDRYSLKHLLEHCGFSGVVQRSAKESYIENWHQFNLDTEPDGSIYKPDSLYMEAVKPAP